MSSFEINKRKDNTEIIFSVNLVANSVEELRTALKKLISENVLKITMNFQDIDMIDSMGIGLLVSTHNILSARNGEMLIINLSSDLQELFSVMRLDEFFSISGE
jgi:anti-anti-sigma factor